MEASAHQYRLILSADIFDTQNHALCGVSRFADDAVFKMTNCFKEFVLQTRTSRQRVSTYANNNTKTTQRRIGITANSETTINEPRIKISAKTAIRTPLYFAKL
ncbi:MAG: hypothetical protein RSF84_07790 [Ruthenibacterium sp.]